MRYPLRLVGMAAVSLLLAGCGFLNSGTLAAPAAMTVDSAALGQNVLPRSYTCHAAGKPVSPPLAWSGAPSDTKSYAIVVDDSSAPITPYIYWIVFDIGPDASDIQQGVLPTDARQAMNSAGTVGYDPPCPQGSPHQYRFSVYALDTTLSLPSGTSLESAWTAIAAARVGFGRYPATANP
jgi:Raf kinase inhibitor-like YbhB/YbcL family protein